MIVVSYRFKVLPHACPVTYLSIGIMVHSRLAPGIVQSFPIGGLQGTIRIPVPDFIRRTPDVANAAALTREGNRSKVVAVRIQ